MKNAQKLSYELHALHYLQINLLYFFIVDFRITFSIGLVIAPLPLSANSEHTLNISSTSALFKTHFVNNHNECHDCRKSLKHNTIKPPPWPFLYITLVIMRNCFCCTYAGLKFPILKLNPVARAANGLHAHTITKLYGNWIGRLGTDVKKSNGQNFVPFTMVNF